MDKKITYLVCLLFLGMCINPVLAIDSGKSDNKYLNNNDLGGCMLDVDEDWAMFRNDPGNTGYTNSIAPSSNQLRWKEKIDDNILSATPIVYDDKLFMNTGWYYGMIDPPNMTGFSMLQQPPTLDEMLDVYLKNIAESDGGLYCRDASTGEALWEYPFDAPNTPAVENKKLYITDFDLSSYDSSLYCLNTDTGEKIWDKPVGTLVISPTIIADDKLFFGGLGMPSYNGIVKCYDTDGNSEWSYSLPPYEVVWFSSPAYSDGKVYFIASDLYSYYDGKIYCLDAETGGFLWSKSVFTWWIFSASQSPICYNDQVYIIDFDFSGYTSRIKCLDADTGDTKWAYDLGFSLTFATPSVTDDSVLFTSFDLYGYNSLLYRVHSTNGTLMWKRPVPGFFYYFSTASPICSVDKVIITPGSYYSFSKKIYCYDINDGAPVWNYDLDYETISSPSIANERLYIADYMGTVYAFEDVLKIEDISGGIGSVKALIGNTGYINLTNITWSISVIGGALGLIHRIKTGEIDELQAGDSTIIRNFPLLGFGPVEVIVTVTMPGVNLIKKETTGFALGPILLVS